MGVAVIFGLAVATVLTLVVVPVMYDVLTGWTERNEQDQRDEDDTNEQVTSATPQPVG